MGKYYYDATNKSKQDIFNEYVKVCKSGSSRDCRIVIQEARRMGISLEELSMYYRQSK